MKRGQQNSKDKVTQADYSIAQVMQFYQNFNFPPKKEVTENSSTGTISYKQMKLYLANKQEFLKLKVKSVEKKEVQNQNQNQNKQVIGDINIGFVQANGQLPAPKKRFQPPSKFQNKETNNTNNNMNKLKQQDEKQDKNDQKIQQRIYDEIIETSHTQWSDIAGLDHVRDQVIEIALWPLENPSLFEGIISPGSGLLLFGPPGTGKTMIGKAIASEGKATFFSIKASSLTSKWVGEGEKTVRALFQLAAQMQPSVIFFDEIDSLLCSRNESENEASRQIKTEFMVQLEGANRTGSERIVFIGATNRPQELDDAIRRRFQKKIYIPLPNLEGRLEYFDNLITSEQKEGKRITLNSDQIMELAKLTKGYSGADIRNLSREACMYPVREAARQIGIKQLRQDQIRATNLDDFKLALKITKPTVNKKDLEGYLTWNQKFGSYNYDPELLDT